ncbi:MAG TPA: flagellar hook-associated protein FlgK [Jatrophihabitans sp.]
MGSTFGGIVQAGTGLTAASYGLQVVSQNIDNVDTPGYTRQSAQQVSLDGVPGVPITYVNPSGLGGVGIASTARLNDPVVDSRSRTEHGRQAIADTNQTVMSQVENVFPEPSDTGLTEQLNDFWKTFSPLTSDAGSDAPRSVVLGAAATVVSTLNAMSQSLDDVSASTAQSLNNTVTDVNAEAVQLNTLNKQIAIGVGAGQSVNQLLDQRDVILGSLATQVDAKPTFNQDGTVSVAIGTAPNTQPLVSWTYHVGGGANQINVDNGDPSTPATYALTVSGGVPSAVPPIVSTTPAPTATAVVPTGGEMSSFYTMLTSTATGIPAYKAQLDTVAQKLAASMNNQQAAGWDLNGNAGVAMFATSDGSSTFTAANITVASGFTDANIAASSIDPTSPSDPSDPSSPAVGINLDGGNAMAASMLGTTATSPDKEYQSLVGNIGQASKLATQAQATQTSVTTAVDQLRTAASGVSTDEEISNLLTYQRSYQASSRVISTLDDMLDTLINKMGV